jgi:predicted ATPase/DNA-binding SARP family transcriptional activator
VPECEPCADYGTGGLVDGNPWRIELLGATRARYRDGAWIPLSYQKPVALLLYLAAHPERPYPREALVEIFWPEFDPEVGRQNLRVALYALRRLLESDGASSDDLFLAERTTLRLDPAAFSTDLGEYLAAVSAATRAQTPADRSQALGHAAACYTGEFLPGFNDAWAFEERERLATTHRELLQRLLRVREELGDAEGALAAARKMVCLDPLWEESHYEVMRLCAAAGQPQAVLRQYQELERVLREELDETPSAEARALAEELRESARTLVVARRLIPSTNASGLAQDPPADAQRAKETPAPRDGAQRPVSPAGAVGNRLAGAPGSHGGAPIVNAGKLPIQWTRFYGRQAEIARLKELLSASASRLVTVTGPGGSGKTRLAIAAVGRLGDAPLGMDPFPKTVLFVALADVTDAARIPEAIADALGIDRSPAVAEQVIGQLAARPWLLVLDNYEHLVEEGALWVRSLLERVPTLTCLVTSRQRLGISGEQEFALLPLPTPRRGVALEQLGDYASVQLFVDRAQAVRSEFALTLENAASVAELCDRLDGLPLALELAAARIAVLSPREMLGRLKQRFAFLVTRQRDTPARHRTLLAVIESSCQLLDPGLQQFFARLSVFRGGWTLEAAEAVCSECEVRSAKCEMEAERPSALDYLEQLRDCSLLTVEEGGRYRLLEALREYGEERLAASGERAEIRRRHRDWYLQLAERAWAEGHRSEQNDWLQKKEWLSRLERDLENFRTALKGCLEDAPSGDRAAAEAGLRLACALTEVSIARGCLAESLEWLEDALAHSAELPASLRATAFGIAGNMAAHRGESERSTTFRRQALLAYELTLSLARREGNPLEIARVLILRADLCYWLGDLDAAWQSGVEARQHLDAVGQPQLLLDALLTLSSVARTRGDLQAARSLLEEQLAILRTLGRSTYLIHALGGMGHLERDAGNYERAYSFYEESLGLRRELGHLFAVAQSIEDMAVLAGKQGRAERAIRLLGGGEAFCETLGTRPPVADAQQYEGTVAAGRAALGEAGFAAAWAAGRAWSVDEVVAYVLQEESASADDMQLVSAPDKASP